jgi:methionyl-tRNA synthetase
MKNFYITTPIYYVNDIPHIGHAYTTIAADVAARFKRLDGYKVFFLTGTDEHGQKVQQAAKDLNVTPQQHVDKLHQRFKELWVKLNISNSDFIRTTEERHKRLVCDILQKLHDKDEIYRDS